MVYDALVWHSHPIRLSKATFVSNLDLPVRITLTEIPKFLLDTGFCEQHSLIRNQEFATPLFDHRSRHTIHVINILYLSLDAIEENISPNILSK